MPAELPSLSPSLSRSLSTHKKNKKHTQYIRRQPRLQLQLSAEPSEYTRATRTMCAMTYLGIAAKRSVKTDSNSRATDVGTHTHLHAAEGAQGKAALNQHTQAANQQISSRTRTSWNPRVLCRRLLRQYLYCCTSICTVVLVKQGN